VKPLGSEASIMIGQLFERLRPWNYILLGSYPGLPLRVDGSDIDIYIDLPQINIERIFKKISWHRLIDPDKKGQVSFFKFIEKNDGAPELIMVDVFYRGSVALPVNIINILNNNNDRSGLISRLNPQGIFIFKVFKYFSALKIREEKQLSSLFSFYKENIHSLDLNFLTADLFDLGDQEQTLLDFLEGKKIPLVFKHLMEYRNQHTVGRKFVRKGILNLSIHCAVKAVYQIIRDKIVGIPPSCFPLIAVVGNDGCGKTTFCKDFEGYYRKLNPVVMVMRRNCPALQVSRRIKEGWLSRCPLLVECIDFADRFVRFGVCWLWVRADFGPVLFERYPTDRIRGELDENTKDSWFPLEKFFPQPNGYLYFDVKPGDSLVRKPSDGHHFREMYEKRVNYICLMKCLDSVQCIESHVNISNRFDISACFYFSFLGNESYKSTTLDKNSFLKMKRRFFKSNA